MFGFGNNEKKMTELENKILSLEEKNLQLTDKLSNLTRDYNHLEIKVDHVDYLSRKIETVEANIISLSKKIKNKQSEEVFVQDNFKTERSMNHLPEFEKFYDSSDESIECGILYGDSEESSNKFLNYFHPDEEISSLEVSHYSCLYLVVDLEDQAFKLGHTTNIISKGHTGSGSIYYRFKDFGIIKHDDSLLDRMRVAVWAVSNENQFESGQRVENDKLVSKIIEHQFRDVMLKNHTLVKNGYGYEVSDGLEWKNLKEHDNVPLGLKTGKEVAPTEWRHLRGKDDSMPTLDIFEKEVVDLLKALNKYVDEKYSTGKKSGANPPVPYYNLTKIDLDDRI